MPSARPVRRCHRRDRRSCRPSLVVATRQGIAVIPTNPPDASSASPHPLQDWWRAWWPPPLRLRRASSFIRSALRSVSLYALPPFTLRFAPAATIPPSATLVAAAAHAVRSPAARGGAATTARPAWVPTACAAPRASGVAERRFAAAPERHVWATSPAARTPKSAAPCAAPRVRAAAIRTTGGAALAATARRRINSAVSVSAAHRRRSAIRSHVGVTSSPDGARTRARCRGQETIAIRRRPPW